MALFRDEKEALRRLEEALREESDPQKEGDPYCEEDIEDPDALDIDIRNTDRTDVDPEELTQRLHAAAKRRTAAAIIALLTIAAAFLGLSFLLRQM